MCCVCSQGWNTVCIPGSPGGRRAVPKRGFPRDPQRVQFQTATTRPHQAVRNYNLTPGFCVHVFNVNEFELSHPHPHPELLFWNQSARSLLPSPGCQSEVTNGPWDSATSLNSGSRRRELLLSLHTMPLSLNAGGPLLRVRRTIITERCNMTGIFRRNILSLIPLVNRRGDVLMSRPYPQMLTTSFVFLLLSMMNLQPYL